MSQDWPFLDPCSAALEVLFAHLVSASMSTSMDVARLQPDRADPDAVEGDGSHPLKLALVCFTDRDDRNPGELARHHRRQRAHARFNVVSVFAPSFESAVTSGAEEPLSTPAVASMNLEQ
jgi:hypothetical protein